MNKPTDREEQRFAQMLKTVEPAAPSPADPSFLEQLKARTTDVFRAAPDQESAAAQPPVIPQGSAIPDSNTVDHATNGNQHTSPLRSRGSAASRTSVGTGGRAASGPRRTIPLRTPAIRRFVLAASILLACLAGLAWWGKYHAGVAFAEVIRAIDNVRSVRFTTTIKGGDAQPVVMKTSVLDKRVRQEMASRIASIIDTDHEKILTLLGDQKKAILLDAPGLNDAGQGNRNLLLMLRECLHGAKGNAEDLGRRRIGEHSAQGFRANDDGRIVTLWVDVDTALPLEVELPWGDGATTILVTDYDFSVALDESLFAMTPPSGYTLLNAVMNLKDTTEEDLVQLLNLLAKGGDDYFPNSLALGSLEYDIGRAESKLSAWDQFQMGGAIARAIIFLQGCHDPKYVGAGVALGEGDRAVYWYRPKSSPTYRVIYGDLSIRDVPADQLPKTTQATPASPEPTIVDTFPADGTLDVDPTAKEIRLHFDQDMRSTGSVMVDKDSGNPRGWLTARWLDARTCVLPVDLRGSYGYTLRINEWGNRSFRSVTNQVLPGRTIQFTTAPAAGQPSLTPEQNRAAIDKLRTALQGYPHLLAGANLDGLLAQHQAQLESCKSAPSFAHAIKPVLAPLHNGRITILFNDQWLGTYWPSTQENCSWKVLAKLVPGWHENLMVRAGRFPDGIGYLAAQTWWDEQKDSNRTAIIKELTDLADAKGLILDMRGNGDGGLPETVAALAGCFIDQPVVYAIERDTTAGAAGEPPKELRLEPNTASPRFRGKVVMLIGPGDHGNTEQLALMMKQVPGCVLMGQKTCGMFGTDEKLDLGNGVTITLPKYAPARPDGTDVSGGVAPDTEVPAAQADFDAGRDPVLEAALKALRE